jgi:hypothetical protein
MRRAAASWADLAARAHCLAALQLAGKAGDHALIARLRLTQSTMALWAGDPHVALSYAQDGSAMRPVPRTPSSPQGRRHALPRPTPSNLHHHRPTRLMRPGDRPHPRRCAHPRHGRKPNHWSRIDQHYETPRLDMKALLADRGIAA